MAETEFNYKGAKIIIESKINEKMKNICQNFANIIQTDKNNLSFSYDGKSGNEFNEELTLEEMINLKDKKRKKIKVKVSENKEEKNNIIKYKI